MTSQTTHTRQSGSYDTEQFITSLYMVSHLYIVRLNDFINFVRPEKHDDILSLAALETRHATQTLRPALTPITVSCVCVYYTRHNQDTCGRSNAVRFPQCLTQSPTTYILVRQDTSLSGSQRLTIMYSQYFAHNAQRYIVLSRSIYAPYPQHRHRINGIYTYNLIYYTTQKCLT